MTTLFRREQILDGLIFDVADCLAIERSDIQLESQIFFSGDSLEILDMTFRIQKRFGIRVHLQKLLECCEVDPDGKISAGTIQNLNAVFPQINWHSRLASIQGDDPFELLTVGLLADMVIELQKSDSPNSNGEAVSTAVLPSRDESVISGN